MKSFSFVELTKKHKLPFIFGGIVFLIAALFFIYSSIPLPDVEQDFSRGEHQKVSLNGQFTVRFDQPMNRQSVESNFLVEPSLAGSFDWPDSKTLEFKPSKPLSVGEVYVLTIGSLAKSKYQKVLGSEVQLHYEVSGPPFVQFVSPFLGELPIPDAPIEMKMVEGPDGELIEVQVNEGSPTINEDLGELLVIPSDQTITVMFDRPIRPLSTVDVSDYEQDFPELRIAPPLKGEYRWIGTKAFQFVPEEWVMGTTYQLSIPEGIETMDGGTTQYEINWTLATEAPRVLRASPFEGDDIFGVEGEIELFFNQPMDLSDVRPGENLQLFPTNDLDVSGGLREDGFFNGEVVYGKDEDGKTDKSILVLKPTFPYQYDLDYQLVIKAGLKSALSSKGKGFGNRSLMEDFTLNFKTLPKPKVLSYSPRNADQNYKAGRIEISFSSPMNEELIKRYASVHPSFEAEPQIYFSNRGREVELVYPFKASTDYIFTFEAPFEDIAGNKAEKGFRTSFKTAPKSPYLNMIKKQGQGFFMEGFDPGYTLKMTNINTVQVELCEVPESTYLSTASKYRWYSFSCSNPSRRTLNIEAPLNEIHFESLNLSSLFDRRLDQGIYFVSIQSDQYVDYYGNPRRMYQPFFISDTSLTMKRSGQDLLVWATDLKTGKPVGRMEIEVRDSAGEVLQRGVTDGNGVYKITKELNSSAYVFAKKNLEDESRWTMVGPHWGSGIETWRYDIRGDWISYNEPRVYLYSERPLYKPGDLIHFKGIYRLDLDAAFEIPKDNKVQVVLEDPEYNELDRIDVSLRPDGSFDGQFILDSKTRVGRYNLYAETVEQDPPDRFYHYFFVEEFKKPTFRVELVTDQVDAFLGDPIEVDLQANYFFGGAITGGSANWTLMREPYSFDRYRGEEYYSFGNWQPFSCWWWDCSGDTEVIDQGDVELENGRATLILETDQESELGQSYLYTLDAEVENQDGQFVNSRKSFIAHQGSFYIGLHTKDYIVKPNDELELKVISVDAEGKSTSGKRTVLELYREQWNTVEKQGVDGAFYEESVRELKFVKNKTVTTQDEPVEVSFDISSSMPAGRYIVQAKAFDGSREVMTEASFYVSSHTYVSWGASNNHRMELVTDKPEYFVGGKAKVLVKSPFGSADKPAKALITYERGTIQSYDVVELKSNSDVIEVPISEEMVPNVYVSVLVVNNIEESVDSMILYQRRLILDGEREELEEKIAELESEIDEIKLENEEHDNRTQILISRTERELEDLNNDLEVLETEYEEITFGEDERPTLTRPDFKMGIANLVVSKREHEILIDLETSKTHYEVGETVQVDIHTRDYQNRPIPAIVSLAVVDESLLALKANRKMSPLDYFLGQRALQVTTSQNLTLFVDQVAVEASKGSKGGDGGLAEGFDKKRGEFKDTAYFNPVIQTDQGGYAKIEFDPPDNLTSWEMWAVASSGRDRFGMEKRDFIVRKPIALTSILPRFVISGDELTVGTLVHNQSGEDVEAKIELESEAFEIKGGAKKSVSIPDGESRRVDWTVKVNPVFEDQSIEVLFKSKHDTLSEQLSVKTFSFPEVVALNGFVETEVRESVRIPDSVEPEMGGVEVGLGSSLVTSFIQEFEGLSGYPYGCAEQITSKILPLIVLQLKSAQVDLLELVGIDAEQNNMIIKETLQKLSKFQRFDGGYGFWEGSHRSSPFLTAYLLYAQHLAKEAGFTISDNSVALAVNYLWKELNRVESANTSDYYWRELTKNDRALILWVLSETGQHDTGMTLNLYEDRDELSLYAQALLLMNLTELFDEGQRSVKPFIEKLKSEIVSRHKIQDRQVHFEEKEDLWWDLNTNRRTTAMVLMALNRENPDNPLLPNIMNYLVHSAVRKGLVNTQETAWILNAVLEYAHAHGSLNPDFRFQVKVNGDEYAEGIIDETNLGDLFTYELPITELIVGNDLNHFDFVKNGEGQMIYDLQMEYYLPNEKLLPQERGFHITRDYYRFNENEKNTAVTWMKSGDIYRGELNLIVPEDMYYVVVEERLPAGVEAINFNLDTANQSLQDELLELESEGEKYWYNNPLWRFNHKETRHDRVLLFADFLPKGVYKYNFLVRAGLPGTYHHLPASAYQMYFPEVFGRTGGSKMEIKE